MKPRNILNVLYMIIPATIMILCAFVASAQKDFHPGSLSDVSAFTTSGPEQSAPAALLTVRMVVPDSAVIPVVSSEYMAYKKMKSSGTVLLVCGGIVTVAGLVVFASSFHKNYWGFPAYAPSDGQKDGMIICLTVGIASIITGSILSGVGSSKIREFNKRQKGFSFDIQASPRQTGLSLKYRF